MPLYGVRKDETKEEYVKRHSKEFFAYALITPDGKWHESSKKRQFGSSSSNQNNEDSWRDTMFEKFIKNTDPELYITIVDCHI